MRVRLEIKRHELAPVKLLWTTSGIRPGSSRQSATIAQLLQQVNEVIPLELGSHGIEDYVVEVQGYECLHFCPVKQILHENDEVTVRPLEFIDLRSRRISGRHQISNDGRHLFDGVVFGRPFLRYTGHSAIQDTDPEQDITPHQGQLALLPTEDDEGDEVYEGDEGHESVDDGSELYGSDKVNVDAELADLAEEEREAYRLHRAQARPDEGKPNRSSHKRKRSEGLGIEGVGFSNALEKGMTISKKMRASREAQTLDAQPARRSYPRKGRSSSIRAVRFQGDQLDTPATLRRASISSSIISEKENMDPSSSPIHKKVTDEISSSSSSDISSSSSGSDTSTSDDVLNESDGSEETSSTSSTGLSVSSDTSSSPDELAFMPQHESISLQDTGMQKTQEITNSDARLLHPIQHRPPHTGSVATKSRNQRRKLRMRLERLKDAGVLSAKATLQDCRDWSSGLSNEAIAERLSAAIEAKRQLLLSSISSKCFDTISGNDINAEAKSNRSNGPSAITKPTETSTESFQTPSLQFQGSEHRVKAKLASNGSNRMLPKSVGLRAVKENEKEIKSSINFLQSGITLKHRANQYDHLPDPATGEPCEDDSWKSKVIVTAVECCGEPRQLPAPPFPFVQRWHQKSKGRHRRLALASEYPTKSQQQATPEPRHVDQPLVHNEADLPKPPDDVSNYPLLTKDNALPGSLIMFRRMELSKATHWCPVISDFRTAYIKNRMANDKLVLELAQRDRPVNEKEFDPVTGKRVYVGFEAPDSEDDNLVDENPGMATVEFSELIEARLFRPASQTRGLSTTSTSPSLPAVQGWNKLATKYSVRQDQHGENIKILDIDSDSDEASATAGHQFQRRTSDRSREDISGSLPALSDIQTTAEPSGTVSFEDIPVSKLRHVGEKGHSQTSKDRQTDHSGLDDEANTFDVSPLGCNELPKLPSSTPSTSPLRRSTRLKTPTARANPSQADSVAASLTS